MTKYDFIIIGAGWGGFNAALEARKHGKTVCLIEKADIGGTCLNRGCIPTKVLTHFAHHNFSKTKPDIAALRKEQKDTIARLTNGMKFALKSQKVDSIQATAQIISSRAVIVEETAQKIEASNILIATGSKPRNLSSLAFDHTRVLSSDDILTLEALPKNILIIGGGIIGCEFASALHRLGVMVTIMEVMDCLLPMYDSEIGKKMELIFQKAGMTVHTGAQIENKDIQSYEKVLVCIGREAVLPHLESVEAGVGFYKDGYLNVNDYFETPVPGIYAVGDCIGRLQLAHVASHQAKVAVANMCGAHTIMDYSAIPSSVFTSPECAQVGITEDIAQKQSRPVQIIRKHFLAIGMAHILHETEGFLKLIIDKETEAVIGASVIGPRATELINTITIAVQFRLNLKQLNDLIFAHPSISEIFTEAIQG